MAESPDHARETAALVGKGSLLAAARATLANRLLPPRAAICHALRLIYYPVPKAGSSTIQALLVQAEPGHRFRDPRLGTLSPLEWQHLTPEQLADLDDHGYIAFTVVRNPWARLVSSYRDMIQGLVYGPRPGRRVYPGLERYNRLLLGYPLFHAAMSFEQFARAVARIPDMVADQHIASQYVRFTQHGNIPPGLVIIPIEQSNEIIRLFRVRGLTVNELPRRRSSQPCDWRTYYADQALVDLVGRRYHTDAFLFRYTAPEWPYGERPTAHRDLPPLEIPQ